MIGKKAYITNNTTNTPNDWGGGGVFVQGGNSAEGVNSACLKISNALITKNSAKGYGGGFAACPSGKTAITDANGIAIFGNTDANGENLSGGTNGKNEDQLQVLMAVRLLMTSRGVAMRTSSLSASRITLTISQP